MKSRELSFLLLAVMLAIAATGCRFAAPERKTQSGGQAQKDIALTRLAKSTSMHVTGRSRVLKY